MEKENGTVTYVYSAKQQEEVINIRKKYIPQREDKIGQLRRLDQMSTKRGTILAVSLGIVSALIFGGGMCCSMLGTDSFVIGIVIGVIGIIGAIAAYPVYRHITAKDREKLAPQIIALSDELMK